MRLEGERVQDARGDGTALSQEALQAVEMRPIPFGESPQSARYVSSKSHSLDASTPVAPMG